MIVKQKSFFSYFYTAVAFTILGVATSFSVGVIEKNVELGLLYAYQVIILTILEVSLSFDNAVMNAGVLEDMNEVWKKRFLTWGMLIAVFGMRLLFPILVVMFSGHLSLIDATVITFSDPKKYEELMLTAKVAIAGFGGSFLLLVYLKYFIDYEKDVHWIAFIEKPLSKIGKMDVIQIAITCGVILSISKFLPQHEVLTFITSSIWGIVIYILADGLEGVLNPEDEDESGQEQHHSSGTVVKTIAKNGLAGFIYLEVLDSSLSFDGVIGAFAITNIIWIIAIGLGAGALFIRSFTIYMVDTEKCKAYIYLEHGALWAIGALAFILLIEPVYQVPEVVTGFIGVLSIILAVSSSIKYNKLQSKTI